jgi:hypothetical protein
MSTPSNELSNASRTLQSIMVLVLLALFCGLSFAQTNKPAQPDVRQPPSPENHYYFTEPSPSGNWLFRTADLDIQQTQDPGVPVIVARPLVKNGELNGTFAIRVRLIEIQFQNGTVWTEVPRTN